MNLIKITAILCLLSFFYAGNLSAQSKKVQITTLNNRVDSFRLALSNETQVKLENEKNNALKINNLKIEIKNSEAEIKELKRKLVLSEKKLKGIEFQIKQKDSTINYLVNKFKFYDEDFNKLMFDESGDFGLDTILNHKNWLSLKHKVHGYDGSDESEKYKIIGFPKYRLIRYHSYGEMGGAGLLLSSKRYFIDTLLQE